MWDTLAIFDAIWA